MKYKALLFVFLCSLPLSIHAQTMQTDTASVYRSLIPESKQTLLNNIDIIANTQLGFRNDFYNKNYTGSKFSFGQFRMEIKGYVHKKIFFRFRHRFTSTFQPQTIDKIIKGVDMAYFRFDLSEKWQLLIGKMLSAWGGIELDYNPIEIFQYSDIIANGDFFLTGAGVNFHANKDQGITFQLLDSRTGSFEELYDTVPDVKPSKVPLSLVANWNGKFFNGKFITTWSYSLSTEAKGYGMHLISLGNQFKSEKVDIAYDYKISFEQLDRTGIISDEIPDNLYNYAVKNTQYRSHWVRIVYRPAPRWHFLFDTFLDKAFWKDDLDPLKTEDKFRTSYCYIPTVEFYPWKDFNLKFYLNFIGKIYKYSDYAKNRPGLNFQDYSAGTITIGLISPLHIM